MSRIKERLNSLNRLLKNITKPPINTYLDLGCGDGSITTAVGKHLKAKNVFGADVDMKSDINFNYLRVINNQIPLADNSVDFITCFVSIHHFEQIHLMFLEIDRVLKDGGLLYIRDHDIINMTDYTVITLMHIFYAASQPDAGYSGYYCSRSELHKYLERRSYNLIATHKYRSPNPQQIYHSLYRYRPLADDFQMVYRRRENLKYFKSLSDTVSWFHHYAFKMENVLVYKICNIYGIKYKEGQIIIWTSRDEVELYNKLKELGNK